MDRGFSACASSRKPHNEKVVSKVFEKYDNGESVNENGDENG